MGVKGQLVTRVWKWPFLGLITLLSHTFGLCYSKESSSRFTFSSSVLVADWNCFTEIWSWNSAKVLNEVSWEKVLFPLSTDNLPSFICELPARVYILQTISLAFHLFFLSLPLLKRLLKSHTYWEAKATMLRNFTSFCPHGVPEVCSATALREASW